MTTAPDTVVDVAPPERPAAPSVVTSAVPRVTLRPEEAAAALGVSRDYFDEHIADELRLIRRGRLKLYAVKELERWAESNAERVLG